jgi:SpoVK/Ycf46/Vps4 family AAA+-type ATPase
MDGVQELTGVTVVAATNRPEVIVNAVLIQVKAIILILLTFFLFL